MSPFDVLVVGGTHGNELNAPWLLRQWQQQRGLVETHGLMVHHVIGNPEALAGNRRYIDRDLNRSFRWELLEGERSDSELVRARELMRLHGPDGVEPCAVAIDLHSTTSAMGNCLVVYGRRHADLALAALVQGELGLPVYLHEGDASQTGYLVESWPAGLVIEVGPVPQGVLDARIVQQTQLALESCLKALAAVRAGVPRMPPVLVVHRHLGSCDLPRDGNDAPSAILHPLLRGQDWIPLAAGQPTYRSADGQCSTEPGVANQVPVFVNEAAYAEKRIAFSLTQREVWSVDPAWCSALKTLLDLDQPQAQMPSPS